MSEAIMMRLAKRAAEHPDIENAVLSALRSALPRVIETILREEYAGESVQFYVPMIDREARANLIRAAYNGRNLGELAKQHRLSIRQVRRIVDPKK